MNNKKRILIVSHNMRIGGVERSLLGLLNSFDYTRFEVDLFLFLHDGEFLSMIPDKVNLLPEIGKYTALLLPAKKALQKGYLDVLLCKTMAHLSARFFCKKNKLKPDNLVYETYMQKYVSPCLPEINDKEYDLAISFLTPHYIAAEKTKHLKSIAWIHTDYSFFDFDKKTEEAMWNKYNYIASISPASTKAFAGQFPSQKDKIVLIENILSQDFVRKQAEFNDVRAEMYKQSDEIILCSVGRFSQPKNFDNVPLMCKELHKMGCLVKWYLIGYGGDEALIRAKIAEAEMQDYVIILGKKENPYPYIKACDIYVQPSRFEGKAVTVREAQMLGKPVVITQFTTSASQLENGEDGIIVPMDNKGCAQGIKDLVDNKKLQDYLIQNCLAKNWGNEDEVEKIYRLID